VVWCSTAARARERAEIVLEAAECDAVIQPTEGPCGAGREDRPDRAAETEGVAVASGRTLRPRRETTGDGSAGRIAACFRDLRLLAGATVVRCGPVVVPV